MPPLTAVSHTWLLSALLAAQGQGSSSPSFLPSTSPAAPGALAQGSRDLLQGALHAEQELAEKLVLELCSLLIFAGML